MSARFPTLLNLVGKQTTKGLMIWILKILDVIGGTIEHTQWFEPFRENHRF
jgi:hypothetical protein